MQTSSPMRLEALRDAVAGRWRSAVDPVRAALAAWLRPPAFLALVRDPANAPAVEALFAASRIAPPFGLPPRITALEKTDWASFRARPPRSGGHAVLVAMPDVSAVERGEVAAALARWAEARKGGVRWATDSVSLTPCLAAAPGSTTLVGDDFLSRLVGEFAGSADGPNSVKMYVEDLVAAA